MLDWIQSNIPPWLYILFAIHFAVLGLVAYLILLERKVASWVQDRVGPNRVGPFGLLQPLADGLKFFIKEDYRPKGADKILFTIAPIIMIIVVIISIAVIPWGGIKGSQQTIDLTPAINAGATPGQAVAQAMADIDRELPPFHSVLGHLKLQVLPAGTQLAYYADPHVQTVLFNLEGNVLPGQQTLVLKEDDRLYATYTTGWHFQIANVNIGVLYIVATLSLAVYGVVVGGWASNNKYSFLGGLRATANMISYEIPMGLAIVTVVVMFGTLDLAEIVDRQAHYWAGWIPAWNIFAHPLAFFMFLICIHAEANRAPFDTAEAEQELVGGYHTEYSSMRFALFFMAEYAGMVTTSALLVALFLGGWHFPGLTGTDPVNPSVTDSLVVCLLRTVVFFVKTILVLFIFMWVRWSLPRFRFDQILNLAWRGLIPVGIAIFLSTVLTLFFFGATSDSFLTLRRLDGTMALIMLGSNAVILAIIMSVSRLIPASNLNRRVKVPGSRFQQTPLPGSPVRQPAPATPIEGDTGPAGAATSGAVAW